MSKMSFMRASAESQDVDHGGDVTSDTTRRALSSLILGTIMAVGLVPQAQAFPSVTKQVSKEAASKKRAAKMKEKVAKAKATGGFVQ